MTMENTAKNTPKPEEEKEAVASQNIIDIAVVVKIEPSNSTFYKTPGGFIGLKFDSEDKGRVGLFRLTPFTNPNSYISVRDMDLKEIGMIYNVTDFPKEQQELINDELTLRYFTPEIIEITKIYEEYGYTFVEAKTDAGNRDFTMRDLSNNIIFLSSTKALLVDTENNRYLIPDIKTLNDKAMRIIGVWA